MLSSHVLLYATKPLDSAADRLLNILGGSSGLDTRPRWCTHSRLSQLCVFLLELRHSAHILNIVYALIITSVCSDRSLVTAWPENITCDFNQFHRSQVVLVPWT